MREPVQGSTSVIVGRGVRLAYGGRVALADSDLDVPRGRVTAVIGPNGSGKSTLLHAVAGLLSPLRGVLEVRMSGPRGRHVAYVLQSTDVNESMPVTVAEVVAMGRYARLGPYRRFSREDRAAVPAAMARLGVEELADARLTEISDGERQRVFVAQGLVQEAELLLLDEPMTALDLVSRETIRRAVEEERSRGTTVVMTTHDLDEATGADHVLLLAGRVVSQGPPAMVLSPEALSEAYGVRMVELEAGTILDDPHHRGATRRHLHFDRTGHAEHGQDD